MNNQIETSDPHNIQRNPHDSINNFISLSQKNEISKEQENEMARWKSSSKLKGAIMYFIGGLYMLIAGIVFQVKYDQLTELRQDYYLLPQCLTIGVECAFTIHIDSQIVGPVYLFVEMKNYNQNTFTYFEKYNPSQVYDDISDGSSDSCKPFRTNKEVVQPINGQLLSIDGTVLNDNDIAFPCGLRAYDHFRDTFSIKSIGSGSTFVINTDNISWKYDREKIKNKNKSQQWIDLEDETIQIWMRPSGLSKFRKTIGRINENLDAGDYEIKVSNVYDFLKFDTTKTLILSNVNSMGGKSLLLVVSHLAGGAIAILASIGLALWHYRKKLPQ